MADNPSLRIIFYSPVRVKKLQTIAPPVLQSPATHPRRGDVTLFPVLAAELAPSPPRDTHVMPRGMGYSRTLYTSHAPEQSNFLDGGQPSAAAPPPRADYFPASRLAVISPTLSIPEPRMTSMARATSAKRTLSSPLTNATFSARSLKTSVRRGPSESQVASSSLIFSLPVSRICTTIVFCKVCGCCCWLGGAG